MKRARKLIWEAGDIHFRPKAQRKPSQAINAERERPDSIIGT